MEWGDGAGGTPARKAKKRGEEETTPQHVAATTQYNQKKYL